MQLLTTWFGSFLIDEGKVVQQRLFPKDADGIAARLTLVEDWKVLDEERELMALAEDVFVAEPRLERAGGNRTKERGPFLDPEAFGYGRELLHAAMVRLARARMRRATGPEDHLRQAVGALDEIQEQENALLERLREWYGLHFPELAPMVDPATYVDLIAAHGHRERMPLSQPESVGALLGEREEAQLRALAGMAKLVNEERKAIEAYVERSARDLAPNVAELAGPMIAARLVTLAGGVEKLARAPAGTVQLLGAERALFRHLRSGSPPPKHGVLFQHPWVHRAPRWQRGAIARAFAGRISMAARADAYTKRHIAPDLLINLQAAIEEIRRRKAERPAPSRHRKAPTRRSRTREVRPARKRF
jgi:nucleolar protein 56